MPVAKSRFESIVRIRSLAVRIVVVGTMVAGASLVSGQEFPSKTVRIVTAAVGGGNDIVARLITPWLAAGLGQAVIVDNRAGGVVSAEIVSRAPPDGYTLLYASGSFWIGSLLENTPYDPVKDFAPVTLVVGKPSILVVHPSMPIKSVKELIALAKARPGELNYASAAPGASNHLAAELFKAMAGVNVVRVPYRGGAQAVNALLGGEVQLMFPSAAGVTHHIKSGRLRALAVTSAQPSALFPELPTLAASGVPGYESVSPDALFVPANTPAAIINRLNQEMLRVLKRPDAREKLLSVGVEAAGSSPEQLSVAMKSEMSTLGKLLIKNGGIRGE